MRHDTIKTRCVRVAHQSVSEAEADDEVFLSYARRYGATPYSVTLLSGGDLDCSRYSILAWDPFLVFTSKGDDIRLRLFGEAIAWRGDPMVALDEVFSAFKPDFPLEIAPFSGGAAGYFAYDLKNSIERLPQTAEDDLRLPDIFLIWPRRIMIHDRHRKELRALSVACEDDPSPAPIENFCESKAREESPTRIGPLRSNFTHEEYLASLRKIRDYIREGDVYQVNLSQRFEFPFEGDPFALWDNLFAVNPAPFYAFIHAGDHQVLSTSMERFLHLDGERLETRPIKGTRKRGATPEEDRMLEEELKHSPKDDAELSMIVDLLRNDLGRICLPRSVRVVEHKRLEAYRNVYHLVSIVAGRVRPDITPGEILRATFPGGSITGCPKIRAMEIIDELEPHARHVYTGAIGYLGWHRNLDLNVAIRTALIHEGRCCFSVGGGIVYDSVGEDEYQETLHKGRTLFQLIEEKRSGSR